MVYNINLYGDSSKIEMR